jgi:hypothetical protein
MNSSSWSIAADIATHSVNDDIEFTGIAYEAVSGCSETLETNIVHYALSTEIDGRLFVADCYHPDIPDANQVVFRSLQKRYDVFNWSEDYLKLPFIPKAISAFAGRVFAFSSDRIAKINAQGLYVEEWIDGAGVDDPHSVVVTDRGLFFANRNNIYLFDGQKVLPIGNAILDRTDAITGMTNYSYRTLQSTLHSERQVDLAYSSKHQYLLVFVRAADDELYAWGFHTAKQRWDFFTFSTLTNTATIPYGYSVTGFRGEVYYPTTNTAYRLFDNTSSRVTWVWISRRFVGGGATQLKKFYEVKSVASSAPTTTYSVDEGSFASLTGTLVAATDRLKSSIRVKMTAAGSVTVNALEVIYRNLQGLR